MAGNPSVPDYELDDTLELTTVEQVKAVSDPLRTFVWNARGADVWGVMVDGRMLVEEGRFQLGDEDRIVRAGARAARKLWDSEEAQAIIARARRPGARAADA